MSIPTWKLVLRDGFLPILPLRGVQALAEALRTHDHRLIRGATTSPPPLLSLAYEPIKMADAIGFALWQGNDLHTVGEVDDAFAKALHECDMQIGEPAACRWFLNEWDTPSDLDFNRQMLEVIEDFLQDRPVEDSPELVACGPVEELPF